MRADDLKVQTQLRPAIAGLGSHAADAAPITPTNLTAAFPPFAKDEGAVLYSVPNRSLYVNFLNESANTREWGLLGGIGGGGGENLAQTLAIGNLTGTNPIIVEASGGSTGGMMGNFVNGGNGVDVFVTGGYGTTASADIVIGTLSDGAGFTNPPFLIATPSFTGETGAVVVASGSKISGAAQSGNVTVESGEVADPATGASGEVVVQSGDAFAAASGGVTVQTGASTQFPTGNVALTTGVATANKSGNVAISTGGGSAVSGQVTATTGDSAGPTGSVNLSTGDSTGDSSGIIRLTTGTAVSTDERGLVAVQDTNIVTTNSAFPPLRATLETAVTADSNQTYTTAAVQAAFIVRSGHTALRNDSMPLASTLILGTCSPFLGYAFCFTVVNTVDGQAIVLATNAGDSASTEVGNMTIDGQTSATFWVRYINTSAGNESIALIRAT